MTTTLNLTEEEISRLMICPSCNNEKALYYCKKTDCPNYDEVYFCETCMKTKHRHALTSIKR